MRAYGEIRTDGEKTTIEIEFEKPPFFYNIYGTMLGRYNEDKRRILGFLEEWIKIRNI